MTKIMITPIQEYRCLKSLDCEALYAWTLSEAILDALEAIELPPEAAVFDRECGE